MTGSQRRFHPTRNVPLPASPDEVRVAEAMKDVGAPILNPEGEKYRLLVSPPAPAQGMKGK